MGSSGPGGSSSSAPRWRACGPRNGCGRKGFAGHLPPEGTALPRRRELDAEWRLGVAATGLDVAGKRMHLAGGTRIGFDKVLIATGMRARPWPNPEEAALEGVLTLRTREDGARLQELCSRQDLRCGVRVSAASWRSTATRGGSWPRSPSTRTSGLNSASP